MSRIDKVLAPFRAEFDSRLPSFDRCGLYGQIIQAIGAAQFDWKNLPKPMNSHCTELAINSGIAVAYEIPENISSACKGFAVTPCAFVGVKNQIGETDTVITYGSDYSLTLNLNSDKCVLIKNNDYMYSEYINMFWFADMLSKTDESEKALIIWSKMHPIAKASTGIEVDKLKEVLKDIIDNNSLCNVIDDNSKILTGTPTSRDDNVLRLTDENAVEKMHFLSEFHYELIRRYCTLYNMPFRTTAKSAQNLESELHNTDIFSKMLNENRLKCRQEAAEKMRDVFGADITVDFSKLIKEENEVIKANIEKQKAEAETAENVSRETKTEETTGSDEDEKSGDNTDTETAELS